MSEPSLQSPHVAQDPAKSLRVGCVSFLNAIPLIEGIDGLSDVAVSYDVPSALLAMLEAGEVDVSLCPVIDLQQSAVPLEVIPAGGIGCNGPTLTVRIFSKVPFDQVRYVNVDTDSHTSVVLMRVLLKEQFDVTPEILPFDVSASRSTGARESDTMLLIGDKVVTAGPSDAEYPHQLDLGEAWHDLTGLPFVFAVWMTRVGTQLGELPALLDAARERNSARISTLVDRHAASHGWPVDIATRYLGHWLQYQIGQHQLDAMNLFFRKAFQYGFIAEQRPLSVRSLA